MLPIDPIELAEAPTITLAGKEWKVPKIVARQNRIITPAVFGLLDVFAQAMLSIETKSIRGMSLSTDQFDKLMLIAHTAIVRAHPEVTREQMEDWPIDTIELLGALVVIAKQAGCLPKQVPGPLEPAPGTSPAATTSPPTG